jgi:hypothetical protein
MHFAKFLIGGSLATLALAAPLSSASAHGYWHHHYWHHRGPIVGVAGAAGDVVTGVVSLAAVPVVLAADVLSAPFWAADYDRDDYYADDVYYGPRDYHRPHHWHRYSTFEECCYYGY